MEKAGLVHIEEINVFPLIVPHAEGARGRGSVKASLLVVELVTDTGIRGYGEALARNAPTAHAELVETLLAPIYLRADPFEAERLWQKASRAMPGRRTGILIEAVSALDIALWDIMGKALGQPISRLLAGMGRTRLDAYASCMPQGSPEASLAHLEQAVEKGFRLVKVVLDGIPPHKVAAWARRVRDHLGDEVAYCADANTRYALDEAIMAARGLVEHDYRWLEEPLDPDDLDGYEKLARTVPVRLAAGQSDFTAAGMRSLIASRAIGLAQPDCVRAGGISESRRIAILADSFGVAFAPHVGNGSAICAAANLQLAAAMPNFLAFECMFEENPLRDRLSTSPVGTVDPADGMVKVPDGPGLGIEIDMDVIRGYAVRR